MIKRKEIKKGMKKFLSVLLSLMLISTMSTLFVIAEDIDVDGYEFDIDYVDGAIAGEDGVVVTNEDSMKTANLRWTINIICELVEGNVYVVKEDAIQGDGNVPEYALEDGDIIIGIHSDGSENALNLEQKRAALLVKKDMQITLSGIDLVAKTVTNGKATVADTREIVEVPETITVDGVFDDNGWSSDGWTTVDSTTGKWQTALEEDVTRPDAYDFQMRTDDTNLYLAIKSNQAPLGTETNNGNGKGSNFRLWIFVDGATYGDPAVAYTTYNYFLNYAYIPGGDTLTIYQNTLPEGNQAAVVEWEDVDAKSTNGDDYWYIEMSIPFSSFGATTGASFYTTLSAPTEIVSGDPETVTGNNALFYGVYPDGPEDNKLANAPYKAWNEDGDIDVTFADIKLGFIEEVVNPPVEFDPPMGDEVENPGYSFEISAPESYLPGETINVTITVNDIVPESGLSFVSLKLYYDADKVEPVVKNDDNENEAIGQLLTTAPDLTKWESVSKLEEDLHRYNLSYMTTTASATAKEDGSIVITIPFLVKDGVSGAILFHAPHAETSAADYDVEDVFGNGGYTTVALGTETSDTSDTSETSSTPPETTGDAGTIAIAIIAFIALAGTATVASKKRSR